MKYADRETLSHRLPDRLQPLLEAMLKNRRTFSETDEGPLVTDAIRYTSTKQDRLRQREQPLEDPRLKAINELFEFERPIGYQYEAWNTLADMIQAEDPGAAAALVSAPTGFGKTEAFLGPLLDGLARGDLENIALVYPRTALLRDQLGRVLKAVYQLNQERDAGLSVGPYYGDIPFMSWKVPTHYPLINEYTKELKITDCWCGDDDTSPPSFELEENNSDGYTLTCNNEGHTFTSDEVILSRERMRNDPPNVFVTTLQSLESSCLKPNYNILDNLDAIVVDEVHLYQGIYGSHAARLFGNLRRIKADKDGSPPIFVGASATLDSPRRFASKMFGVNRDNVETFEPKEERDFQPDEEVKDWENYYFILSSDDVSLSSTYIQQSMLLGHTQLQSADQSTQRGKMLSFIDSVSSVNQKEIQFLDADTNRRLWRFHVGYNDENWEEVATRTGHRFINKPLEVDSDHSNTNLTASDIANSDVLISTSTLEVGIDIEDIDIITQYHAPYDISSFVQRSGRAGRQEGDSHIVTFLSQDEGDKNLFNRADRFLDQSVTTPLNPENKIVDWVHTSLYAYYTISSEVSKQRRSPRDFMEAMFKGPHATDLSLRESIAYPQFYEFLVDPEPYIDHLIEKDVRNLLNQTPVVGLQDALEDRRQEMQDAIEPIADLLQTDVQELANARDPAGELISKLRARAIEAVDKYLDRLDAIEQAYGQDADVEELRSGLSEVKEDIEGHDLEAGMEHENRYRELQRELRTIDNRTVQLCYDLGGQSPELTYDIGSRPLERLESLLNSIAAGPRERLQGFRDRWQATYYLKKCLEHLEEYHDTGGTSHESAYAVKDLLRSLYFFDRYLEKRDQLLDLNEQPDEPVYYVPEKYFESSGSTFTLVEHSEDPEDDEQRELSEKSLFELFSKYYPFRTHFNQSGELEVFQPPTRQTTQGLEFDFSQEAGGLQTVREADYLRPDAIPLKQVRDCSGSSGQMILNYCPKCYEILNRFEEECPRHGDSRQGKLYSEPRVSGHIVEDTEELERVDSKLSIGDFTMHLKLHAVEIAEHEYGYDGENFFPLGGDSTEHEITFPGGQEIAFEIDTRGFVWDFDTETTDEWVETVLDALNEFRQSDPLGADEAKRVRRHTAAHLLMLVTADVAGVTTDTLRYHVDHGESRVVIYEQAEGGQGVVDLAREDLEGNPAKFLESLLRVSYNPSIISRQCWGSDLFIDRLQEETASRSLKSLGTDDVSTIVDECLSSELQTAFIDDEFELITSELQENVEQEVLSYIDKLDSIEQEASDKLGISLGDDELIEMGHLFGKTTLEGKAPSVALEKTEAAELDSDVVDNLLQQERPDGCINTLHIQNCTGNHGDTNQSDCLSHVLLQTLRSELVSDSEEDDLYLHIDKTNSVPVTVGTDDTYRYISFG